MKQIKTFYSDSEENEVEIWVSYTTYPAIRGARDGFGVPLEPDEPASCDINDVEDLDGKFIDFEALSFHDKERIMEEISEQEYENSLPPED